MFGITYFGSLGFSKLLGRHLLAVGMLAAGVPNTACEADDTDDDSERSIASLERGFADDEPFDTRIQLFEVEVPAAEHEPSRPLVAAARRYAKLHEEFDAAKDRSTKIQVLAKGAALTVEEGLSGGELRGLRLLQVEWAARFGDLDVRDVTATSTAEELSGICDGLAALLDPQLELPRDTASARALVALGDWAQVSGRTELAATSYMRSIDVMTALRRDVEQSLGLIPAVTQGRQVGAGGQR